MKAVVVTTFPDFQWEVCAKEMITSFTKFWPRDIPLLVQLCDDLLEKDVKNLLRQNDGLCIEWDDEHKKFTDENIKKDSPTDYRLQCTRFCHKVFSIKHVLKSINEAKNDGVTDLPRYLIWMDADVTTEREVTEELLKSVLPHEGDSVSYLGRKDWDHSECGFLAFDLENGGDKLIMDWVNEYESGHVFELPQTHDSYVFDVVSKKYKKTNMTEGRNGQDIWKESPLAAFTVHHKGPVAKAKKTHGKQPLRIETKNSLPNESIKKNIEKNQILIRNWVKTCLPNQEDVVVVSAGPMMVPEYLHKEKGKKIVAVKHAIKQLEEVGITPWACILLDPREHVNTFVENPNKDVIWFVASQVDPAVTITLLSNGCKVWGYHASVGAGEDQLINKQPDSIVKGGSATATRGLFLLEKLGFSKFTLYGYDLCCFEKPNMDEKDIHGQPKYFEVAITANQPYYNGVRSFWSTGELLAQYQEMNDILMNQKWDIEAYGEGIVPFMVKAKNVSNLREKAKKAKISASKPVTYGKLLCLNKTSLTSWLLR